jgi:hypothetical protein
MILDKALALALKQLDDAQIDALLTEWVTAWTEKHLTVDEITSEIKDGVGFLKKLKEKIF